MGEAEQLKKSRKSVHGLIIGLVLMVIAAACGPMSPGAPGQPTGSTCAFGAEFETVFRDDFSGPALSDSWRVYDSFGPFGTGASGFRTPGAISVENGLLTITGSPFGNVPATGGMAHRLEQTYGKFSFRVRTDTDPTMSWSGVVLTWPESEDKVRDGENNIYETMAISPRRNPFYSFIHRPNARFGEKEIRTHPIDASKWVVMTMEWTPDRISISHQGTFPDGSDTWTVTETAQNLIPDAPHHLTIQLDATKSTPLATATMQVDWVEIGRYCG